MRRRVFLGAIVLAAFGLPAATAASTTGPDPHTKPLLDGCQRFGAGVIALTTPEWVYVDHAHVLAQKATGNPLAGARTVEGVATDVHPAGDDEFYNHDFNDLDAAVHPDPGFGGLVEAGGSDIGLEWEEAQVPQWAWPSIDDHVRASGSFIWDCGHWGQGSADPTGTANFIPYDPVETGKDLSSHGAIRGEQTELHPLYELATTRAHAAGLLGGVPSVLSQLDVWINSDGSWAHAEEECSLVGLPAAANRACSRYRDVGGRYAYRLKLGPKPAGGTLVVNPVVVHGQSTIHVPVSVVPDPLDGTVAVSFTVPHTKSLERFGITVQAGWTNETTPVVLHHVTLDSMRVFHSLDGPSEPNLNPVANGPEQTPDPAEWAAFASVDGLWQQVPASALRGIHEPAPHEIEVIPLHMSFDVWLPAGVQPTVFFTTRECDIPLMNCLQDRFGAVPTGAPFTEIGYNDHPGRIETPGTHLGLPLAAGTATYEPGANPQHTANEDLSDYTCDGPCYALTVTDAS